MSQIWTWNGFIHVFIGLGKLDPCPNHVYQSLPFTLGILDYINGISQNQKPIVKFFWGIPNSPETMPGIITVNQQICRNVTFDSLQFFSI